jgi:hypothetical protein
MTDNLFHWTFWVGALAIVFSAVVASVRYVNYSRQGARTMAAQAIVQAVLCIFGLVALWIIHRFYMVA